MSLITDRMEVYYRMVNTPTADGEGGTTANWANGDSIQAAVTHDSSTQARIAEHQGLTSTYTVTVNSSVTLAFHDVLKRASDGAVFRITSNSKDKIAPASSTLGIAVATAEAWELT